jgi:thioredoxin
MPGSVVHITSDQAFQQAFKPTTSFSAPSAIFVDFFAAWCGPCKAIAPLIESLAAKYPNVVFLSVDVDKCKGTAQQFSVSAMPTLQAYFGGQKIAECVGADPSKIQSMAADLATRAAGTSAGAGNSHQLGGGPKPAATADELRARMAEAAERRARGE